MNIIDVGIEYDLIVKELGNNYHAMAAAGITPVTVWLARAETG